MATDKHTIIQQYPLPVYNYQVIIDGIEEGMYFSEISGLEMDYEHVLYRHGFSWLMGDHLIRAQRKPINVSLKRGVVKNRRFLYDWLRTEDKKNINIALCDETNTPIVTWEVYRALPIKMNAPSFNASTNDIAIESLDLIAHDIKLTHHE
ncbi:phage tail protein [Aquimarina mytili]|uniref:Phage tail protein n=1 Tax=Aquimarina mytili TaxID=874423 RepID=A0A937D8A5_9FLAO|nr:phage tail protein [Aquimarina mytili]MBL0683875.1 phage tail protein [Aquimarina mytili]